MKKVTEAMSMQEEMQGRGVGMTLTGKVLGSLQLSTPSLSLVLTGGLVLQFSSHFPWVT